jgi:serine/threonine-protein kinase RsbW
VSDAPISLNGTQPSVNWLGHVRAPGTPGSLPLIRQTVVDAAEQCGFCDEDVAKIEMAVGEACTNIIEHSYSTQPLNLDIEVKVGRYSNRLEVTILDYSSINFAVDQMAAVPLDDYIATGRRRGLGLFIIQSFVDKVEHRFVCGQGNELKLTKFFA